MVRYGCEHASKPQQLPYLIGTGLTNKCSITRFYSIDYYNSQNSSLILSMEIMSASLSDE